MTRRAALAALAALWPLGSRAQIDFTPPNPSAACAKPLSLTETQLIQMAFLHALVGWAGHEDHILTAWVMVDPKHAYLVPAKQLIRLAGVEFRVREAPQSLPGGTVFALMADCGMAL